MSLVCKVFSPLLKLLDWLAPLADLLARLWVGYAFLSSGILKLMSWQTTVMLFTHEFQVPFLSPYFAAVLGTAAEITLPILVILGLGGRISVLLLFLFNLTAVISYPHLWTPDGWGGLKQHIEWGAILVLLMCHGMGKFSLDYLFFRKCYQKNLKPSTEE